MSALVKHATVLHWFEDAQQRDFMARDPRRVPTGPQLFTSEAVAPDTSAYGSVVRLEYETWQDMGGPLTITVTVEPGDRLNEDPK